MSAFAALPHFICELRMVLIRLDRYTSDTVTSTILGREAFDPGKLTENEVEEVNGRKVCLVKAPVWVKGYYLCDTPNLVKDELVLSVNQCPPGPHAFIIQIEANLPFTNLCRRSVQQHLELLGENVWNHTLVLFTGLDWQDNYTVEEHIESGGEALQWLLSKCANRYHVFDSVQTNDQVEQLFRKVEEMVTRNSGWHFEMNSALLSGTEQRKNEVEAKAKERRLRRKEEKKQPKRQEDLRVLMLGWVLSGKCLAGNIILNTDEFGKEGHTTKSLKYCGEVEEHRITIVDTPGWWKFLGAEFTSESVKGKILEGLSMCSPYPHAFLLMIPADTSFTAEQKKVVQDNMKLLGEQVWSHTIVVFTYGKWLQDYTIEYHIESEGEALQWLIEKCGNRYHTIDKDVKDINNVSELVRTIEEMVSGNSPYDASREMLSHMEDMVSAVAQKEDAALSKMVEVLYREWDWRSSEWFGIQHRLFKVSPPMLKERSIDIPPNLGSEIPPKVSVKQKRKLHRSVKQKEIIETLFGNSFWEGRESLSELMEKTLKNFEKDSQESLCVNSPEFGETVLKPQWKELIEREWSRRDDQLMYDIILKVSKQVQSDGTSTPDTHEKTKSHCMVLSWLRRGTDSGAESLENDAL